MIRVTIEIVPFGDESKADVIDQFTIVNKGTGNSIVGNYVAKFDGETTLLHIDGFIRNHGASYLTMLALERYYNRQEKKDETDS